MLRVYFGHHKCATSWINRILRETSRQAGWRWANVFGDHTFGGDPAAFVVREEIDLLSCSNARPDHVESLGELRGFHVIRDPRDLLVSAYFSHLHSHPTNDWDELEPHREKLRALSKEDGLLAELDFRARQFGELAAWDYGRKEILELRMEDLVKRPYAGFVEIFRFLRLVDERPFAARAQAGFLVRYAVNRAREMTGREVGRHLRTDLMPAEKLLGIVFDNRFERLSGGRKRGEADARSHFRRGVAGDWRNHFTPEVERRFKERYAELLVALGYEDGVDWSTGLSG